MPRSKPFNKRPKRPKKFLEAPCEESPEPEDRPIPVETASSKKLAISSLACSSISQPPDDCDSASQLSSAGSEECPDPDFGYAKEGKGHRVLNLEVLSERMRSSCVCAACHSPLMVKEDLNSRRGMVSSIRICCTKSRKDDCTSELIADPSLPTLNTRAILAMRMIGRGRAGLESFCGWMDMLPPLAAPSFSHHNRRVSEKMQGVAHDNMLAASAHLHQLHGLEPTQVLDILVTCDGTWCKRGFTATHGIVAVISWESGQVLDYEIMTKRCNLCSRFQAKLGEGTPAFDEWWEGHKEQCECNHDGSSQSMEMEAATHIFARSEELLHLRYTEVISDGDSKTIVRLNEVKPYGPDITIEKHECVGHVQKRVGKRLEAVEKIYLAERRTAKSKVRELKAQLKELKDARKEKGDAKGKGKASKGKGKAGGKGKGKAPMSSEIAELEARLTEAEGNVTKGTILSADIDRLQSYYGDAIRAHPGDLEAMKKACWAVYYHSVSTDENPQHDYCPVGEESTCPYQRWLVSRQGDPPSHTNRIPEDLARYVKPIFEDLCDEALLNRCTLGATQNRNECFNAMIWARAPKTDFASRPTIEFATACAVVIFNSGNQALSSIMKDLGLHTGPLCKTYLETKDRRRLIKARYRATELAKKRRKAKQLREKSAEAANVEEEGATYGAGEF